MIDDEKLDELETARKTKSGAIEIIDKINVTIVKKLKALKYKETPCP